MKKPTRLILVSLCVWLTSVAAYCGLEYKTTISSALQVSFPINTLDSQSDFLSALWQHLPENFPEFKLNTIGRQPHVTLLYLDNLNFDEARELADFFLHLPAEVIARYSLHEVVPLFDPQNLHVQVVGTKSRFIAVKPSEKFIDWQQRFYKMISEKAPPWVMERHKSHSNLGGRATERTSSHMSLVQFGAAVGIPIAEEQIPDILQRMNNLIQKTASKFTGSLESFAVLNIGQQPLEVVQPPRSLRQRGELIFGAKLRPESETFALNHTGSWTTEKGIEHFDIDAWLADSESHPSMATHYASHQLQNNTLTYQQVETEDFMAQLSSEKVRRLYQYSQRFLSPSFAPASVEDGLFIPVITHPELAPKKAIKVADKIRELDMRSTNRVSVGAGVYASAVRSTIDYPGDFDLSIFLVAHVPDTVQDYDSAVQWAAKTIYEDIIKAQLGRLASDDHVAISELRIGSKGVMRKINPASQILKQDPIAPFLDNPYLSEENVKTNQYVDSETGQSWTLPQLIALGDFIKGKIDFFSKTSEGRETRMEQSLQFLAGFEWRGQVYNLNNRGLKGVPPLARTQVYISADSYALASALSYQFNLSAVQKGSMFHRIIRDLVDRAYKHDPAKLTSGASSRQMIVTTKLLKSVYNFFRFLSMGGGDMADVFMDLTQKEFRKEYPLSNFEPHLLMRNMLAAINQPELAWVNDLRRITNDFKEFSQRQQKFKAKALNHRLKEALALIEEIELLVSQGRGANRTLTFHSYFARDFLAHLTRFKKVMQTAMLLSDKNRVAYVNKPEHTFKYQAVEEALYWLEHQMLTSSPTSRAALSDSAVGWLQIFFERAPIWSWRLVDDREIPSERLRKWHAATLGFIPTNINLQKLDDLAERENRLRREAFLKAQNAVARYENIISCPDLISSASTNP